MLSHDLRILQNHARAVDGVRCIVGRPIVLLKCQVELRITQSTNSTRFHNHLIAGIELQHAAYNETDLNENLDNNRYCFDGLRSPLKTSGRAPESQFWTTYITHYARDINAVFCLSVHETLIPAL